MNTPNSIIAKTKTEKSGLFTALLITLGAILLTLPIDPSNNELTTAPVVGVAVLFVLALRYSPRIVTICLFLLFGFVGLRLWGAYQFNPTPLAYTRFWIRLSTFLFAGFLAIAASAYRARLDSIIRQLLQILEAIPVPLLIVGNSGIIHAVSTSTCLVSGYDRENIMGQLITDVAGSHLLEEAEENWFQHWTEQAEGKIFDAEIQLGKLRSYAKIGKVGSGRHALMIVIFI